MLWPGPRTRPFSLTLAAKHRPEHLGGGNPRDVGDDALEFEIGTPYPSPPAGDPFPLQQIDELPARVVVAEDPRDSHLRAKAGQASRHVRRPAWECGPALHLTY